MAKIWVDKSAHKRNFRIGEAIINFKRALGSVTLFCAAIGFAFTADVPRDLNDVPEIVTADE